MVEALWYTHAARAGREPHCQRLSRRPMAAQWRAAIELALSFARGRAGFRQVWIHRTNEEIWYWPDGDHLIEDTRGRYGRAPATGWWIIPRRVAYRARRIYEAAIMTACHAHGGYAYPEHVLAQLEAWARTGHWRRIAARIAPRHSGPRKRRGTRRPARPLPDLSTPPRRRRGRPGKEPT
jgi:hypothetical protein